MDKGNQKSENTCGKHVQISTDTYILVQAYRHRQPKEDIYILVQEMDTQRQRHALAYLYEGG